ncbi:MAG: PAS domain S-box protein [Prolixibacteraceae bacterium]|nr:PAS domain S-box protein [Prolixibacteraceae bacterium]
MKKKILKMKDLSRTITHPPDPLTQSDSFASNPLYNNPDENNLWHSTFNAVEDAICIIDNDQRIVRCNRAMQKLTGNNDGNLIGKHCFAVVHGTEHPLTECPIIKMRQTLQRESVELKLGEQWFDVTVDPLFGTDKQLSGAVHIVRNITTRKQTEEKLQESEQRIRQKLEAILSPDGDVGELELADIIDSQAIQAVMDDFYSITHIGVGLIDMKGKVLVANGWQEVCTRFHRTHPETCRNCIESDTILSLQELDGIGKFKAYKCKNNMWDLSTPIVVGGKHLGNIFLGQFFYEDENPDYEAFRIMARKYGFNEEEYISALDSVPRWNHETVKNVMSFHSRLSLLISNMSYTNLKLARTIEERNIATEELKSNYLLLRMAGETAKFGGWSVSLTENMVIWSEKVAAIHEEPAGYSPSVEQAIKYYAPEWRDKITKVFMDCAEKGIPYDEEMEIITAKSNRIWVRAIGEAVRNENGKIVKVQGAFQDINRQKKTEIALKKSEELLNLFMKYSPIYTFIKEVTPTQSRVLRASENYQEMVGIPGSEMAGKNMDELFPAEFAAKIIADDWAVVSGGIVLTLEEELNGRSYTTIKFPIMQRDKTLLAGYTIDVTDRKQIEERLRLKEEKYRTLFENMTQGVFYQLADSTITDVNEAALEMFGLSRDQMLGRTSYDPDWKVITEKGELLTPEEHPSMKALISSKPCRDSIVGVYNPTNKQYRWLIVNAIPQFSPGETHPKQVFVTVHDITERKQTEAELAESEARFRNLLQDVHSVSVQGYSPDGTTQYWNNASEKLYGYTGEEALGRNLLDLIIPPEMRDGVKSAIQQMAETGQPIPSSELSLMRKDGSRVSVFSSHTIVKSPGNPQELFCVDIDLTERKKAEEEILKSKQQYDSLVSKIPVGVYILRTSPDGAFALEYASPRMAEMLDLSVESLLAHNETIFKAIHPDDLDGFIRMNQKGIQNRQSFDWEGRVVVKGDIKWLNISSSPQPLESGETLWHGLIVDITERIRSEAEIKLKNDELISLNATKDKFFSIIAHDLKSPFNSILGLTDYMVEQIQEKNYHQLEEYATVVRNSSQQAMDLLTNLLDWSRSQTGRMEFKPEHVEIVALINAEIDLLSSSADQKSITLSNRLSGKTIAFVDRAMFSTIMRNLISNAIKFTRPGGRVEISLEEGLDLVKISVSDSGVGIKKERIDKLFRISETYSTSGTLNEKGTGLGLILCNEFVEKHHGEIWVESEEDKGSTFYFSLPVD